MLVLVLDSPSVNESWSDTGVVFGSNPSHEKVPPSSLQSRPDDHKADEVIDIVIVEDNRADVKLIRDAIGLHALSVSLHILDDGEQAFHFIDDADEGKEGCPHLLILDLNLPRRTGKEVLMYLRQSRICAQVPVLIVTSSTVDEAEMKRLGGNGYFRKPTDYDEFMKVGALLLATILGPLRHLNLAHPK